MPKAQLGFDPALYAPVADRIRLFYERHVDGRIITELVSRTATDVVFKAHVYRSSLDAHPAATGWAAEREGDGDVNLVACLENAETSAVGRALANLGYTAARERPSAEEMEKAERTRVRLRPAASPTSALPVRPVVVREFEADPYGLSDTPLQARANQVLDLMRLIDAARFRGLRDIRADRWRAELQRGHHEPSRLARWESRLGQWLTRVE